MSSRAKTPPRRTTDPSSAPSTRELVRSRARPLSSSSMRPPPDSGGSANAEPRLPALLRGLRHLPQVGRVAQMHRRVGFERVFEAQFLADLAHRRHDLLAEEADAG